MLSRTEVHNRLNGYIFVIVEFGLIGVVVGGFGAYYTAHGRGWEGFLAIGVTANAVVILSLCTRALMRGEKGVGLWRVCTNSVVRQRVIQENPRLATDTLFVTVAVLIPFVLLVLVTLTTIRHYLRR